MSVIGKDILYAVRTLRKHPSFTLAGIGTIALGIGASTMIFSVVNAVLLRPLPYPERTRLVLLWGDLRNRQVTDFPFAPGDFHDLRRDATAFEELAAVVSNRVPFWGDDGEPEQVRSASITPNLLRMLGAGILLGRDFSEADATAPPTQGAIGAAPAASTPAGVSAILSNGFWQRRFGGHPGIIGRVVTLGDARAEVVGVLAPGFEVLFPPGSGIDPVSDVYVAARTDYESGSRLNVSLRVLGRLRDGATMAEARGQLDRIGADLRQRFPIKANAGYYLRAEPMHEDLVADVRGILVSLMGAVTFLLLIACANVANLFLVRMGGRTRELAIRAALGGSRWQLVRQVLVESGVLAAVGVLPGLGLATLGIRALAVLGPDNLPRIQSVDLDAGVVAFGVAAAVLAALVCGAVPALRASRPDVMDVLRSGGRSPGLGGGHLLRDSVVVAEVGLSFVLLVGSGLMIRSFLELRSADPGYDPERVLTFTLANVPAQGPEARAAFAQDLHRRLLALPGVQSVTASQSIPLDGQAGNVRWGTEAAAADPSAFQQASANYVLPGYFELLGTRLREGRTFIDQDNATYSRQIIIDRLLAAKAFPGESAVGRRLLVRARSDEAEWLEVIGVVDHQRIFSPAQDGPEGVFFVDGFLGHGAASRWLIRTGGEPAALTPQVRAQVKELSPLIVLADIEPMRALVERAGASTRLALVLIGTFGVIAVVLAGIGLYGVLATAVRQRTAEIGVRVACGASPMQIGRLVLRHGAGLSGLGMMIGLVSALLLTRFMEAMLIGVSPTDLPTLAFIAGLFVIISGVASYVPARRAARLDPNEALRQ